MMSEAASVIAEAQDARVGQLVRFLEGKGVEERRAEKTDKGT